MFEIRCFVADKRLGDALRAVEPFALDPPVVKPVTEHSKVPNVAIPSKNTARVGLNGMIVDWLKSKIASGTKTITATDMRLFVMDKGFAERSYSYALSQAVKNKMLRKTKLSGTYEVIR